ncbi:bacillithiol system redox-active protein YtxJ [Sinomicrobium weinanense]|uniref:Bacillithiol system redox-active protein YtxJ n=1 Tax=Sinomicrobium weinanense TaxID=2842200 RepID=A0A926Q416_9FLAO|nr:bacillithiol system redox-active protein YtxJ [Sinomicrobium weinanense]MBC9798143.1 bacillithiol system redox-active protein YtxJ [Sinomicrobium weinanense]MBU3122578.1 bacillithiol system redox-active protein YtxJ [Sinomicrobium weinanense]
MGFFDTIFGKKTPGRGGEEQDKRKKGPEWIPLTSEGQLDEIVQESASTAVIIFKHSTRCGISRMAYRNFESDWDTTVDGIKLYYLDLLAYRQVSNAVASRFGIAHESPQLLLLKDGKVVYHTSHGNITAQNVFQALER